MDNYLDTLNEIKSKVNTICEILLGDPTNETKPGLVIRLDRLEQSNKFKNKILILLSSGVLIAIFEALIRGV